MMNNLVIQNQVTMTSLEVVDLINKFRLEEGNRKAKRHDVLMRDIRNELEALENAGINGLHNFAESSYLNSQGRVMPCYKLTKKAVMQLMNKESALVRYKTQEYIEKLENKLNGDSTKANLLLAIYNGGQEGILASKRLTNLEIQEVTAPLLETIDTLEPKAEEFDDFLDKEGTFSFRELVKVLNSKGLNLKEPQVREFLKSKEILCTQGKKCTITQEATRQGYGKVIKVKNGKGGSITLKTVSLLK